MKHFSLLALSLLLSVLLAGCGEKAPSSDNAAAPAEQAAPASTANSADDLYLQGIQIRDTGDYATAYDVLNRAAEKGAPCATFFIGIMYENGEGRAVDQTKAIEWYKKSSGAGCAEADKRLKLLQAKK